MGSTTKIGLALSGGGIRAAVFHLGVLRRLADENLLEKISDLSTVSGGSLVTATVLTQRGHQWPTSKEYNTEIYPKIRSLFTTTDLFSFKAIGWIGLARFNRRLLTHRASVLADLLHERWGIAGNLSDLPDRPNWWINATCLATGKNWRFSKREMGDWQFGRHYVPPFRIAEAAAASAAVPYVIGSLSLPLPVEGWYETDPATRKPLKKKELRAARVRLWDGGAYENLGLETLFKPGQALIGCDFLVCSDASGPLRPPASPIGGLLHGHLSSPRLFDVTSDQIRALRSRMFVRDIESGTVRGALVRMGNSVRDIDIRSNRKRDPSAYDRFQADQEAALSLLHPTDLKALPENLFDRIARHGYEVTDATLTTHANADFPQSYAWRTV
jgi:NTE family protein